MNKDFDVVILGGGLAGLTLALQLKRTNADIRILVLEQRHESAPEAAHKVGESTVELGTYYLREVLGLADYLEKNHLPKYGLRFFFSPQHKNEINRRVELGATYAPPVPSHQLDRGIFENYLVQHLREKGVDVRLGTTVEDCTINYEGHAVRFKNEQGEQSVSCQWIVDGSGRRSILKHKLGFKEALDHNTNAVWFRIKGEIDVQDWAADDDWKVKLDPGFRRLATNHLMGKGYWVWLIPLVSGNTSVGIVTDADIHPFEKLNKLDRAIHWLEEHEPMCAKVVNQKKNDVMDFMALKHYSHHSGELYSADRWAVTGDAGAFLDPFYSPGTDFIGMNNSWITDLINRDLNGEDIQVRTMVYSRVHRQNVDSWIPIYRNKYPLFDKARIMCYKIVWDWATYWSIPTLIFTNGGYTDMDMMRSLIFSAQGPVQRFGLLNAQMQKVFEEWNEFGDVAVEDQYLDPFSLSFMHRFHGDMVNTYKGDELVKKVEENLRELEKIATQIYRNISQSVNGTAEDIPVDPYTMSLKAQPVLSDKSVTTVSMEIQQDLKMAWITD